MCFAYDQYCLGPYTLLRFSRIRTCDVNDDIFENTVKQDILFSILKKLMPAVQ